jgi:hypothetical protein
MTTSTMRLIGSPLRYALNLPSLSTAALYTMYISLTYYDLRQLGNLEHRLSLDRHGPVVLQCGIIAYSWPWREEKFLLALSFLPPVWCNVPLDPSPAA